MMDCTVEEMLTILKLDNYIINFQVNNVTNVGSIDDELLQAVGVEKIGHRKRILNEVEKFLINNEIQNCNKDSVTVDSNDEPPPALPPKTKPAGNIDVNKNVETVKKPIPPSRTISTKEPKIHTRPEKPPRRAQRGNSLPSNLRSKLTSKDTMDYKLMTPSMNLPLEEGVEINYVSPPVSPILSCSSHSMSSQLHSDPLPPDSVSCPHSIHTPLPPVSPATSLQYPVLPPPRPIKSPSLSPPRNDLTEEKIENKDLVEDKLSSPTSEVKPRQMPKRKAPPIPEPATVVPNRPIKPARPSLRQHPTIVKPEENDLDTTHAKTTAGGCEVTDTDKVSSSPTGKDKFEAGNSEGDMSEDEDMPVLADDDILPEMKVLSMVKDKDNFFRFLKSTPKDSSKAASNHDRKSKMLLSGKTGYLSKCGGQKGDKAVRKRWVEFNGDELKYFKEKGGDPQQIIPVACMKDVQIVNNARKPTFHLLTTYRKFTFMEPNGKQDELTIWVSIIMEAILYKSTCENDEGGGKPNPDKEGWLGKQGHHNNFFKKRYVVIRHDKLSYYYTREDFQEGLQINELELKLVSLKEDVAKLRLYLLTNTQRIYVFEAEDVTALLSWKSAIEDGIQKGLGDLKVLGQLYENKSNKRCADCDKKDPIYASVKLLVVVCSQCIGWHRDIGQVIAKPRSVLMDEKIWTKPLVKLFQTIGNKKANQLWANKMPSDDMIEPECDKQRRKDFIFEKYNAKRFFCWSEHYGEPYELGMSLRKSVLTDDVIESLRLIISGADVYFVPEDSDDQRTPYELARDAGMELQAELLFHYQGHLTEEECQPQKVPTPEDIEEDLQLLPNVSGTPSSQHEKTGVLLLRTAKNVNWRDKHFMLQGKKLYSNKGARPDDNEMIDLTILESLEYCEEGPLFITLVLPGRTYYLKGFTPEDSLSWYEAIRNKQVIGVPIELQEVSSNSLPYLIEKCIAFVERHALRVEGIYRLSGSAVTIKKLKLMFNQDAQNVRLTFDDCPDVHAVAGLLKLYLRELPESLLTSDLYDEFTSNAALSEDEHDAKLYQYQYLLHELLPKVNYRCLRSLVIHLNEVKKKEQDNRMKLSNIVVIFGPIILSKGNTTNQTMLNTEYAVLADLIEYYRWLFKVDDEEVRKQEEITGAIDEIMQLIDAEGEKNRSSSGEIDSMQITVYVNDEEDVMQMTSSTLPNHVCLYCIKKHHLLVDGNWALFEATADGFYERPVYSKESVLQLAMNIGANRLVVKENYLAEKINPLLSSCLGVSGYLHYAKIVDKWKKNYYVEIKNGNMKVYNKKGSNKEEDDIAIHETLLYINLDIKKKQPGKFGFYLKIKKSEYRYFCTNNEVEHNLYMAAIFNIRYPTGIWSLMHPSEQPTSTEPISLSQNHWGRQQSVNMTKTQKKGMSFL